jgi:hypothetical protein
MMILTASETRASLYRLIDQAAESHKANSHFRQAC